MKNKLFVVILTYIVPIEAIDAHRPSHLDFLDHYYREGVLIASGPQEPRVGGILFAQCENKEKLEKILSEDPFAIHQLAEYQIYEFALNKHSETFHL